MPSRSQRCMRSRIIQSGSRPSPGRRFTLLHRDSERLRQARGLAQRSDSPGIVNADHSEMDGRRRRSGTVDMPVIPVGGSLGDDVGVPIRLRLMADYCPWPIWAPRGFRVGETDLPLSDALRHAFGPGSTRTTIPHGQTGLFCAPRTASAPTMKRGSAVRRARPSPTPSRPI